MFLSQGLLVQFAAPNTRDRDMTGVLLGLVDTFNQTHAATLRTEYPDVINEIPADIQRVHEMHRRMQDYLQEVMAGVGAGRVSLCFGWEPFDDDNSSFGLLFAREEILDIPLPAAAPGECQCGACRRKRGEE